MSVRENKNVSTCRIKLVMNMKVNIYLSNNDKYILTFYVLGNIIQKKEMEVSL